MALGDRRALLASPVGRGLRPVDVARMLGEGYARLTDAPRGKIWALAGSPQAEFVVVLAGRLEVGRVRPDGSRQILDVIGAGGACGAVTAFAEHPRWPAEVHVVEDARLLALTTRALLGDGLDDTRVRLLQNTTRILAERARHMNARAELLGRRGLRERLALFLLRNADAAGAVPLSMKRQALADHLGVSRASMTRELGRMADEGLIAIRGRSFDVLDADALGALA